jgi:tetratricopeptide (TPR) repeat protein
MNLGNALFRLGERQSGTARLEEAVAAYRDALMETTRERLPLDWAAAKMNLGNALQVLGQRESGTAQLEEAVVAFRDALMEGTRERAPLRWATIQRNLGGALSALGVRENGTEHLEQAIAAFGEALKEYTRERQPSDWQGTITSLGYAQFYRGDFTGAAVNLREAVENGNSAYPIIWLYLAGARGGGQEVKRTLQENAAVLTPAKWPSPVIELFLGRRMPSDMVASAVTSDERCEAQFYLGQWHVLRHEPTDAIKLLRNAVETCPKAFIEYAGAVSELKRLGH